MRHIVLAFAAFHLAWLSAPASAGTDFGQVGIYSVMLNDHGACVAIRELKIQERSGRVVRGAFGFGIANFDGKYMGLVSLVNPNFRMPKGQSAMGSISIDRRKSDALFVADGERQLTALVNLRDVKEIAYGKEVELNTGHTRYTVPLVGTALALDRVMKCSARLDARLHNPLGDGSNSREGVSVGDTLNPLGGNR